MALSIIVGILQPISGGLAITTVGGVIFSVMVTEAVLVHPFSVSVTVWIVVYRTIYNRIQGGFTTDDRGPAPFIVKIGAV